ncbi:Hypp121 [Branchiostoma lanceolatum]|uniref:Hypp121 protein n=1 Tax=Branchiostoma lanceolatum TaxID=7740 RepID=A0A8J9YN61_BRALA|nr:Hypp121 [Branchiostoma lanceolatum]
MSRRRTVSEEERSPEGAAATQQKVPKHNVDVSARRPLHGSQIPTDEEEKCMITATEYGVCLSPLEGFDDEDSEFSDDVTISSLTETDGEGGVSASLSSLEEYILDPARILGKASSFTELPMSPVEEEEESPAEDSAQGSSNTYPTEPVAAEFAESFAAVVTKPPPVVEEAVEEAEPVESIPSTQDSEQAEDDLPEKEEEQEESPSEEHAVPDISPEEEEGEESSKDDRDDSDTEPQDAVTEQKDEDLPVSDGAASDDEAVMGPSEVTEGDDKADDEEDIDGGSLEAVRGDTPTDEDLSEKADFESSEKTEGEDSAGADTSSVGSTEHDLKKDNKSDEVVCDPSAETSTDDLPTEEAEGGSESSAADNIKVEKETSADESGEETITSDHEATEDDTEESVKEEDNKRSLLQRQKAMSKGESVESQESASSADTSEKAAASKTPTTHPSTDEPEHYDDVKANEDIQEEDEQTGDDDDEALNKVQDAGMPKTSGTKSQDSSDSEDDSSSKIQPQALATGESTPRDDTKEQCEFAVTSADREYQPNTGASNEGNKECSDGHCYSEPLAVSLPHSEMPCPEQDTGRLRVLPWARWEKIDDTSPRTVRRRPPSLELEAPVDEATSEETSPIQQSAEPMDIKEANESTPRRCSTSSTDSSEGEEEEEEAISSGDEEGEFDVPERTESPEDRMTRTDAWATSGGTVYIGAATRMVRKQLPDIPEHSREDDSEASDDDNQQDEVERPRQSAKLADSRSSEYDRHHEEPESSGESDDDLHDEELHYLDNDDEGADDSEDEDKRQADAVREHDWLLELQEDLFEKDSLDDVDYHVTSSEVLREGEGQSNMSVTEPTDYRCDDRQDDELMAFEQVDPSNANEILLASEGPDEVRAVSSDVPRDDDRRRSAEYTDSSDSESDTDSSESETSADSILASPGNGGSGSPGGQYRAPMSTVPVTSYYVTSGVPFTMDPTTSEHGLLTPIINGHIPVVKHHVQYDDLKRPIIPILLDIGDKLSPEYSGETKQQRQATKGKCCLLRYGDDRSSETSSRLASILPAWKVRQYFEEELDDSPAFSPTRQTLDTFIPVSPPVSEIRHPGITQDAIRAQALANSQERKTL